jgi:hypothetical protein
MSDYPLSSSQLYFICSLTGRVAQTINNYETKATWGKYRVSQKCTHSLKYNNVVFMNISLMVDITEH